MAVVEVNGSGGRGMWRAVAGSKRRGLWPAIVVENKDGDGNPGYRVKLKFPWLSEEDTTYWARIGIPMAGAGRGTYVLPEIDDQVLVVFEHGDIERPIVVGALWSRKQEPVEINDSGKNNTKLIKSRCGHRIIFDDKEGGEKIVIVDKTRKNKIVLDSVNKVVKIESDGELEVIAKANVILHANALKIGTSEGITGKGRSLLTHAAKTFGLKASQTITVGGGSTTINVANSAATSVSGAGSGELAGAPPEPARESPAPGGGGGARRSAGAGAGGAAAQGSPQGAAAAPAAQPATEWVEVELRDADGNALAREPYEIKTPDGHTHTGVTDASGALRISQLPDGMCEIKFPRLDENPRKVPR